MEMVAEQTSKKEERVHRVGSVTTGISMIGWGALFVLYEVHVITDLALVLKLWPVILISLGVEILCYNARGKNLIYDKGAVFILILMTGFSLMMAFADQVIRYMNLSW